MQFTAVIGEEIHGIGQGGAHVKNSYSLLLIKLFEQMGQ